MKRLFLFAFLLSLILFLISMTILGDFIISSGAIHLGLFSIASFFLWKKDLATTMNSLKIPGDLSVNAVFLVAGLALIFAAMLAFGIFATAFGFNDESKVAEKIESLPIIVLAFAVVLAPLSEELFFRGLLSSRIGIVFSSLAFGLVHFSYGSVVEIVGAFMIGMILAVVFRTSKSIMPCILIHMSYNLLSITVMRLVT